MRRLPNSNRNRKMCRGGPTPLFQSPLTQTNPQVVREEEEEEYRENL